MRFFRVQVAGACPFHDQPPGNSCALKEYAGPKGWIREPQPCTIHAADGTCPLTRNDVYVSLGAEARAYAMGDIENDPLAQSSGRLTRGGKLLWGTCSK